MTDDTNRPSSAGTGTTTAATMRAVAVSVDVDESESSRFTPNVYREGVSVAGTEYLDIQRVYLAECVYSGEERFLEGLLIQPKWTPCWFSSTTVLFIDSSRRRYKDLVLCLPKMKARQFSETVFLFPKAMRRVFTTTLVYQRQWKVSKWYTSGVELSPPKRRRRATVVGIETEKDHLQQQR